MPSAHPTDIAYIRQLIMSRSEPVTESGCWLWTSGLIGPGYGAIKIAGHSTAHRASYEAFKGPIPIGMAVCHTCDTRECVNPDHLWLGTRGDNIRDCVAKGRNKNNPRKGERHHKAKLSESDVIEIRLRYSSGTATYGDLAAEYGVDRTMIGLIVRRKNWAHI